MLASCRRRLAVFHELVQAVDIFTQEKVCRGVQRPPVEQILEIDRLAAAWQFGEQLVRAVVEYRQVAKPVSRKHGADHATAVMPLLSVDSKDTIAEERPPELVPLWTMTEAGEVGRKDGLDLPGFARDEHPLLAC